MQMQEDHGCSKCSRNVVNAITVKKKHVDGMQERKGKSTRRVFAGTENQHQGTAVSVHSPSISSDGLLEPDYLLPEVLHTESSAFSQWTDKLL